MYNNNNCIRKSTKLYRIEKITNNDNELWQTNSAIKVSQQLVSNKMKINLLP